MFPQENEINDNTIAFQVNFNVFFLERLFHQEFQSNRYGFYNQEKFTNDRKPDDINCEYLSELNNKSIEGVKQQNPKRFLETENIPQANRIPRKHPKIFERSAAKHRLFCLIVILVIHGNHGIIVSNTCPYDLPTPAIPVPTNNSVDIFGALTDGVWSLARQLGTPPPQIGAPFGHGFTTDVDSVNQDQVDVTDHVINSIGHKSDKPNRIFAMKFQNEGAVHLNTGKTNSSLPDTYILTPEAECTGLRKPHLIQHTVPRKIVRRSNGPSMVKSKTFLRMVSY